MIITHQYRLVPSKEQYRALESILESQRLLYNAALEERIGAYRRGIRLRYVDQCRSLTEWRRSDADATVVPVALQRATLKRLDDAYAGFFRRCKVKGKKPGFPRFRGRGWWDSFGFSQFHGIRLEGRRLRFNGMPGALRMHLHRPLPQSARIRCCTFRSDSKGWLVNLSIDVPAAPVREGDRSVGVDLGITIFAALSDGGFIPSLRSARRAERRLRLAQRSLARKRQGSRNRRKARLQIARLYAATARARTNHLHQASARLIRDYDKVAVESLNIHALMRRMLSREVHDASWAKFLSMLRYKAERAGVRLFLIRAGVGPGLLNVADRGKRAGGNPGSQSTARDAVSDLYQDTALRSSCTPR